MNIHELEMAKGEELKKKKEVKKTHCAASLKKIPVCHIWRTKMFLLLSENSSEWTSVRCFYFFQNVYYVCLSISDGQSMLTIFVALYMYGRFI